MIKASMNSKDISSRKLVCYAKFIDINYDSFGKPRFLFRPIVDKNVNELRDHNWFYDLKNDTNQIVRPNDWVRMNAEFFKYQGSRVKLENGHITEILKEKDSRLGILNRKIQGNKYIHFYNRIIRLVDYLPGPINCNGSNINMMSFQILLFKFSVLPNPREVFVARILRHNLIEKEDIHYDSKKFKELLLKFLRLAVRLFRYDFRGFCAVIDHFSRWNKPFAEEIAENAPNMFKNMLLGTVLTGKSFPISNSGMLAKYLRWFNSIKGIKKVSKAHLQKILSRNRDKKRKAWDDIRSKAFMRALTLIRRLTPENDPDNEFLFINTSLVE